MKVTDTQTHRQTYTQTDKQTQQILLKNQMFNRKIKVNVMQYTTVVRSMTNINVFKRDQLNILR